MKNKSGSNVLEVIFQQMKKCCRGELYKVSIEGQDNGTICLVWSNEGLTHTSVPLNFCALNMTHKSYNDVLKLATKAMKSNNEG